MAIYANYFEVGHNAFEFLIDFSQFQPDTQTVRMHSRIVTGPVHAKLLAQLLAGAVARFESEHGEIADLASPELDAILLAPSDFERRAELARAGPFPPIEPKR
ncbi:MAG: DUF3467 domain-containing protein [Casimicrobiaceae bacterium]